MTDRPNKRKRPAHKLPHETRFAQLFRVKFRFHAKSITIRGPMDTLVHAHSYGTTRHSGPPTSSHVQPGQHHHSPAPLLLDRKIKSPEPKQAKGLFAFHGVRSISSASSALRLFPETEHPSPFNVTVRIKKEPFMTARFLAARLVGVAGTLAP